MILLYVRALDHIHGRSYGIANGFDTLLGRGSRCSTDPTRKNKTCVQPVSIYLIYIDSAEKYSYQPATCKATRIDRVHTSNIHAKKRKKYNTHTKQTTEQKKTKNEACEMENLSKPHTASFWCICPEPSNTADGAVGMSMSSTTLGGSRRAALVLHTTAVRPSKKK